MSANLDTLETDAFTALRAFLVAVLPGGVAVIRGQVNRVAEPDLPDFVILTAISRERLSTNHVTYSDGGLNGGSGPTLMLVAQPTRIMIQADVHGPQSANNAQIIATLFRDGYAYDAMAAGPVQPLYASEPMQMPFLNGENQLEFRWVVDLALQGNQTVTVNQQFANTAVIGLLSTDAVYPP